MVTILEEGLMIIIQIIFKIEKDLDMEEEEEEIFGEEGMNLEEGEEEMDLEEGEEGMDLEEEEEEEGKEGLFFLEIMMTEEEIMKKWNINLKGMMMNVMKNIK